MQRVWGRGEAYTGETLRKESLGRPWRRWEDNFKMGHQEGGRGGAWTGMVWFRTGTADGHLCIR